MQLELSNQEVQVLRRVVESHIDGLLLGIANTDSREFRQGLVDEEETLRRVFEKLGCVHAEMSQNTVCSVDNVAT